MKKLILPVGLFLFAAGGAFATNTASDSTVAIVKGYRISSNPMAPCQITNVNCSTIPSANLCTDGSVTLHQLNGTSCGSDLFQP